MAATVTLISGLRLAVVAVLIGASALTSANLVSFVGEARDPETNALLYSEVHRLMVDDAGRPVSEEVDYVAVDNRLLAQKSLTYTTPTLPQYRSRYFTSDRFEQVTLEDGDLKVIAKQVLTLPLPTEDAVIDSGFHYYLQSKLPELAQGEEIEFLFLAPGRGEFLKMSASPEAKSGNVLTVTLRLKHWLFGALVPPIELKYQLDNGRLLQFTGFTNIPTESGKPHLATINYIYSGDVD